VFKQANKKKYLQHLIQDFVLGKLSERKEGKKNLLTSASICLTKGNA
jgi:hypothetical protein